MLYIRTGKPGHGKTLNTIKEVDASAFKQSRIVYFHNVTGLDTTKLKADWFEFDEPEKWYELPANSIIVIDEAQFWFGSADPRAEKPAHVVQFTLMRKQGFEVHLITQDPRLLHVDVRRIAHVHVHYWRVMKSNALLRFQNEGVVERVENMSSFKDADKTRVRIDKKFFDVYKSANAEHHFKFEPSKKLIWSIIIILVAAFMVYRVYGRYSQGANVESSAAVVEDQTEKKSFIDSFISVPTGDSDSIKPQTVEEYLSSRAPRVSDIPSSAPVYDQLTAPVSYPRLFCVSSSDPDLVSKRDQKTVQNSISCQCYTQQATKFHTSFDFCLAASKDGYFDHALPDRSQKEDYQTANSNSYQPMQQNSEPPKMRVDVVPHEKQKFPIIW